MLHSTHNTLYYRYYLHWPKALGGYFEVLLEHCCHCLINDRLHTQIKQIFVKLLLSAYLHVLSASTLGNVNYMQT